jgi:glutathione synthase/RimK-type ligase-like ATP-grasp enzyme
MILVVSHSGDEHTMGVLAALERDAYPAVLIDTGRFPLDATLTQWLASDARHYEFADDGRKLDLRECRAGWWRRPQAFALQAGMSEDVASFSYSECHEAVAGLWAALDLRWVNPPELDERAHHKPYQLSVAASAGLPIPRTVITNDPDCARVFISEMGVGRTVYKTFLASEQCWRETRIVRAEELGMLDLVRLAPVIFQEYVPAVADVRVTVVGNRVFATAIRTAPGSYEFDYRMDLQGARFEAIELPRATQEGLHNLMKKMGLVFGAIDLRLTPAGEYVFLEVNPAGEWLFVEEKTDQQITCAMAGLLRTLDQPNGRAE